MCTNQGQALQLCQLPPQRVGSPTGTKPHNTAAAHFHETIAEAVVKHIHTHTHREPCLDKNTNKSTDCVPTGPAAAAAARKVNTQKRRAQLWSAPQTRPAAAGLVLPLLKNHTHSQHTPHQPHFLPNTAAVAAAASLSACADSQAPLLLLGPQPAQGCRRGARQNTAAAAADGGSRRNRRRCCCRCCCRHSTRAKLQAAAAMGAQFVPDSTLLLLLLWALSLRQTAGVARCTSPSALGTATCTRTA